MSVSTHDELLQAIARLSEEQLRILLEHARLLVTQVEPPLNVTKQLNADDDPFYTLGRRAGRTGIKDLAHQHDHYIYGTERK